MENVVSAPHTPVPSSGRRYSDGGVRSCSRVTSQPSANAPATFTISVAHGHAARIVRQRLAQQRPRDRAGAPADEHGQHLRRSAPTA